MTPPLVRRSSLSFRHLLLFLPLLCYEYFDELMFTCFVAENVYSVVLHYGVSILYELVE